MTRGKEEVDLKMYNCIVSFLHKTKDIYSVLNMLLVLFKIVYIKSSMKQGLPIYYNDADNIHNISRYPNSSRPLHKVDLNLEHKSRETAAYNQLYCIAYMLQQSH